MTKRTKRKIDSALKAKIALEAWASRRRSRTWPNAVRFIPTQIYAWVRGSKADGRSVSLQLTDKG